MPKLGFNMSVGKLVKWYKSEGQEIKKGEAFFSIETDKTNMDIEATGDGYVIKLLIDEGDQAEVTLPIAIIGEKNENVDALIAESMAKLGKSTNPPEAVETELREGVVATSSTSTSVDVSPGPVTTTGHIKITPRARKVATEKKLDIAELNIPGTGYKGGICEADILMHCDSNRGKITKLAEKLAVSEGVDISNLTGTGINKKIMKSDVETALATNKNSKEDLSVVGMEEAAFTEDGREIFESLPYAGVRRIIGERLSESKFTAPHLYFTKAVDLSKVLEVRQQLNSSQDHKTSVTDFVSAAVIKALQKLPDINSSLQGDQIIKYKTVNLGIAVAAPGGLIVPVVKNAEKKDIIRLSKESSILFGKARENKLLPSEYSGGTFTISNLGMFDIDNFTAIINQPESAILAISATVKKPVVVTDKSGNEKIEIRPMTNITLTVDHRVIDGLMATQFIVEVKKYLENPISLIL